MFLSQKSTGLILSLTSHQSNHKLKAHCLKRFLMMAPLLTAAVLTHADNVSFSNAYDQIAPERGIALKAASQEQKQVIKDTLLRAGMSSPITAIVPSKLPSMYQVTLANPNQPPLHITADGQYILQGELKANPSPKKSIPPKEATSQILSGMPVSPALRDSMLNNSSSLKNMTADVSLYYTSVPGVIWGVTFNGQPFITNTDASVFTSGEISVIKNGQFAGLDANFEQKKNRYILSHLDEDELVVYPASIQEKAVIYMASDINCPYCRIMHADMDALNAKGITVKVIGYPVYEQSPEQMRQIWCENDKVARRLALDNAMRGAPVPNLCASNTVNNLYDNQALAAGLAVFATPAIYREDGVQWQGTYQSPDFLEFLGV